VTNDIVTPVLATLAFAATMGWVLRTTRHPRELDMTSSARKKMREMEETVERMRFLAKQQEKK
jgi:ABC-type uncharacterized transport system permease subunit